MYETYDKRKRVEKDFKGKKNSYKSEVSINFNV